MKDLQQMAAEAEQEQATEAVAAQDRQAEKALKDLNELELYFFIEECGYFCWRMNHDMADGRVPQAEHAKIDADVVKIHARQVEAIKELPRFGVEHPLKDGGGGSDTYWAWYRKWKTWHQSMSDAQWQEVNAATRAGITAELLEKYRKEADEMAKNAAEEAAAREAKLKEALQGEAK